MSFICVFDGYQNIDLNDLNAEKNSPRLSPGPGPSQRLKQAPFWSPLRALPRLVAPSTEHGREVAQWRLFNGWRIFPRKWWKNW